MQNNTNTNTNPLSPAALAARPLTGRARRLVGAEWIRTPGAGITPPTIMHAAAHIAACGTARGCTVAITLGADRPAQYGAAIPLDMVADACTATDADEATDAADAACDQIAAYALLRIAHADYAGATHAASAHGIGRTLPRAPRDPAALAAWLRLAAEATMHAPGTLHPERMPRAVAALVEGMRARLASQWASESAATASQLDTLARAVAAITAHPETAAAQVSPPALEAVRGILDSLYLPAHRDAVAAHADRIAETLARYADSTSDPQRMPMGGEERKKSCAREREAQATSDRHDTEAATLAETERAARAEEEQRRDASRTAATPSARATETRRAIAARMRAEAAARQRERAEQWGRAAREIVRAEQQARAEGGADERAQQEEGGALDTWHGARCESEGTDGSGDPIGAAVRAGCAQSRTGRPASESESLAVEVIQ